MSQPATLYEKIDLYLSGGLPEQDKLAFEKELALRPDWQKKVDAYRVTNQLVLENHLLEIKEWVNEVHEKHEGRKGKKIALSSAGLLLVVGGIAFCYLAKETPLSVSPSSPIREVSQVLPSAKESTPVTVKGPEKVMVTKPSYSAKETSTFSSSDPVEKPAKTTSSTAPYEAPIAETQKEAPVATVEEPSPIKPIDPCAHVVLEASIFTTSTCEGEEKGSVTLSSFKGGRAPYQWSLKDAHQQSVAISGLQKGVYHAVLSDAQHCSTTIRGIEIKEKACVKAYHFNPFIGEKWEIPLQTTLGKLTVLDKNGNVYFSAELPAGSQEHWSGESAQGELKTGIYLYTITHSDGTVKRGTVSIVR